MTDFVLVHGTTQGPSGWGRLAERLERSGHRVRAVDLPTDRPDSVPDDYAAVARRQASDLSDPVVVAHSASGLVLPAIARALEARRQVWLAAWVPQPGVSMIDELEADPSVAFNAEWIGQDPTTDPVLAAYFLFHDCDLVTLRWALGTLRAFLPRRAYAEPIALAAEIPSTYVVASLDRTILPGWSHRAARERLGIKVVELDAGHCPHVSRADELAELLTAS